MVIYICKYTKSYWTVQFKGWIVWFVNYIVTQLLLQGIHKGFRQNTPISQHTPPSKVLHLQYLLWNLHCLCLRSGAHNFSKKYHGQPDSVTISWGNIRTQFLYQNILLSYHRLLLASCTHCRASHLVFWNLDFSITGTGEMPEACHLQWQVLGHLVALPTTRALFCSWVKLNLHRLAPKFPSTFKKSFIYCVHVCGCMHATAFVCWSKDNV